MTRTRDAPSDCLLLRTDTWLIPGIQNTTLFSSTSRPQTLSSISFARYLALLTPRSPVQNGRYFAILSSTRLTKWPPFLYSSSSADRLEQNTELFLSGPGRPPAPADFHPVATSSGGLKLAPFPARKSLMAPVNYMTAEESAQMKDSVFALLDQFDSWVLKNQNCPDIYLCIEIPHSQYNASASSACIPSRTTTLSGNTCAP